MSVDAGSDESPLPDDIRVGKLDTLDLLRSEMGKLYRASRRKAGRYPTPSDAARLAYLLQQIGQALIVKEFGHRIAAIENRLGAN